MAVPAAPLIFSFPGLPQVGCAFQLREQPCPTDNCSGGNMTYLPQDDPLRVRRVRQALLQRLETPQWAELKQVHGDALHFEPEPASITEPPHVEGDGMATQRPGLALCIRTADCQPVLLTHQSGRYVMALHVGWRGNRCRFPVTAVQRFCAQYHLDPQELLAVRGPSLGPGRAEFRDFSAVWSQDFLPWYDQQSRCMDLWGLTRHQLQQAGLLSRNIYGIDICTASNPQLCFSYRHDHQTGRQASFIWIREKEHCMY